MNVVVWPGVVAEGDTAVFTLFVAEIAMSVNNVTAWF